MITSVCNVSLFFMSCESSDKLMRNIWYRLDKYPAICYAFEGAVEEKGVLGKRKNVKWTLVRSTLPVLRSSASIVGSSLGAFFLRLCQSAMWPLTLSLWVLVVFIGRVPLNQQCSLSHFFPLENDKREGKHYFVFLSPPHLLFQSAHLWGVHIFTSVFSGGMRTHTCMLTYNKYNDST